MASYKLLFRDSVGSDLAALPKKKAIKRLLKRIRALEKNPRPEGCEKLSGQERYRLRHARCRVVYEIQDMQLTVVVAAVNRRPVAGTQATEQKS